MDLRSWLSALGGAPAGGAAYGMAAPPVQNSQPMGLAVPPMARGTKLSAEMDYDGSHPRQQEQAARDHFRSYGPQTLADAFIPGYGAGGDAKAASEAYGEGRYGAAAGNALMAAMDFVPMLAALPAAAKGIRAYHGSPHDFDRFDMSKIGTGEGAQAYGHGLYFADSEDVARSYRDNLAVLNVEPGSVDEKALMLIRGQGGKEEAANFMRRNAAELKAAGGNEYFQQLLARIESIEPQGRMYEVNINADPEAFLDWDKPLSEQPVAVRQAAAAHSNAVGFGNPLSATATGKDIAGRFAVDAETGIRAPAFASKQLRDAGIPGIKYLDAGSRGAGDGSRNYVVFDDRLITILRKYGIGGLIAGGGAYALTDAEYAQAAELLAQDGMNTGAQ